MEPEIACPSFNKHVLIYSKAGTEKTGFLPSRPSPEHGRRRGVRRRPIKRKVSVLMIRAGEVGPRGVGKDRNA